MALRLAAVYAHPDDDTYSLAGVLAVHRGAIDYTLIVATSGEAGPISDPALATRESLAQVREGEEREALAAVGAESAAVHFLRYPDGGLKEVPVDEVAGKVADILAEARPQVVVTFGPEGVTGHEDHTKVCQVATQAFGQVRAAGDRGDHAFQRLYYSSISRSHLLELWEKLRSRGIDFGDPDAPFKPRGVSDRAIAVRVDCSSVIEEKLAALRAHRTQRVELDYLPEDVRPWFLGVECFVQAWPPPDGRPGPVRRSLIDGVEE